MQIELEEMTNSTTDTVSRVSMEIQDQSKTRIRRSVGKNPDTDLLVINITMSAVYIALLCVFALTLTGWETYKDKQDTRHRTLNHDALAELIKMKHNYITNRVNEFHVQRKEIYTAQHNEMKDKFDMLVTIFKEICREIAVTTPYPVRLTRGHTNEDFATMVRITHWNGQWRDNNNTTLKPSAFLGCTRDLPKPQNRKEWQRLARIFYEESGSNIILPRYSDVENMENDTYTPTLGINQLALRQLCRTPVCFNPNVELKGKESKCQYCMQICCNCTNCIRFRGFFKIRTALINTGKVDSWDHHNEQLIKSIQQQAVQKQEKKTLDGVMKVLFQRAREQQPGLPETIYYLEDDDPFKEKLRHIAVRMLDGPVQKMMTADERVNRLTDDLSQEILIHFLKSKHLQVDKIEQIMNWLLEQYHYEEGLTKGGSDVVVNFDNNMRERNLSEEVNPGSSEPETGLNRLWSETDDEDNVSIGGGYESVD